MNGLVGPSSDGGGLRCSTVTEDHGSVEWFRHDQPVEVRRGARRVVCVQQIVFSEPLEHRGKFSGGAAGPEFGERPAEFREHRFGDDQATRLHRTRLKNSGELSTGVVTKIGSQIFRVLR